MQTMRLQEYRIEAGLTQSQLAEFTDYQVSQPTISQVELMRPRARATDGRPPSLSPQKMRLIKDVLNERLPENLKIKQLREVDEFNSILSWLEKRAEEYKAPRGKCAS